MALHAADTFVTFSRQHRQGSAFGMLAAERVPVVWLLAHKRQIHCRSDHPPRPGNIWSLTVPGVVGRQELKVKGASFRRCLEAHGEMHRHTGALAPVPWKVDWAR